jgi:hypothetical protein
VRVYVNKGEAERLLLVLGQANEPVLEKLLDRLDRMLNTVPEQIPGQTDLEDMLAQD